MSRYIINIAARLIQITHELEINGFTNHTSARHPWLYRSYKSQVSFYFTIKLDKTVLNITK